MSKALQINPKLVEAIRKINPNMTDSQIVRLVDKLQGEIGLHISAGELLAFLSPNPNGGVDLTVLNLEIDDTE